MPRPTSQDLAGFWDLLQLSIDDVTMKFDQLQQIKNNNWRPIDSPEKKVRGPSGTALSCLGILSLDVTSQNICSDDFCGWKHIHIHINTTKSSILYVANK